MRKPIVTIYSSKKEGVTPLKGYVIRGNGGRRINFTTPIVAPSSDLSQFNTKGYVRQGSEKPPHQRLRDNVRRYYLAALSVAIEEETAGNLERISGKEFTAKVNDLYFQRLAADQEKDLSQVHPEEPAEKIPPILSKYFNKWLKFIKFIYPKKHGFNGKI